MNTLSTLRLRALVLAAATVLAAAPAFAGKGEGHGHGNGNDKHEEKAEKHEMKAEKHEQKRAEKAEKHGDVRVGGFFTDDNRAYVRRYYTEQYGGGRGCPPGLAKKNNGCMPPGQARNWVAGQPLPRTVTVYSVPQPVIVQLPSAPSGYRYVRVGNDILLLSPQSSLIVDVIHGLLG